MWQNSALRLFGAFYLLWIIWPYAMRNPDRIKDEALLYYLGWAAQIYWSIQCYMTAIDKEFAHLPARRRLIGSILALACALPALRWAVLLSHDDKTTLAFRGPVAAIVVTSMLLTLIAYIAALRTPKNKVT